MSGFINVLRPYFWRPRPRIPPTIEAMDHFLKKLPSLGLLLLLPASSFAAAPTTEPLELSLRFEHKNQVHDKSITAAFNQTAIIQGEHGLSFEITPRKLSQDQKATHGTLLLEMTIKDTSEKNKQQIIAKPIISIERGGSATIEDHAKNAAKSPYELSVVSLR